MSLSTRKVAIVGLGRMGANMARRLRDQAFEIAAVYDVHRDIATALAAELRCPAPDTLAAVTAAAGIILTVVTDDRAMREIFTSPGDSLLTAATGRIFINFATVSPQGATRGGRSHSCA
jgi:3-hydroxyisobutyrate dehydrogenase